MNIQIDAKGKQCPLPVIEAKNAISGMTEAGIVEVTVDNEIAVQNLTKMADHKGLKAKSEKKSDQEYTVWMEVTEEFVKNNIKDGNVSSTPVTEENCIPDIRKKKTVVVLGFSIDAPGGKYSMDDFIEKIAPNEYAAQMWSSGGNTKKTLLSPFPETGEERNIRIKKNGNKWNVIYTERGSGKQINIPTTKDSTPRQLTGDSKITIKG